MIYGIYRGAALDRKELGERSREKGEGNTSPIRFFVLIPCSLLHRFLATLVPDRHKT
jgi:hypothetical protein